MKTIQIVTELLSKKGISAAKMCKSLGFSSGLFYQWKKGLQNPSFEKISKMADYFEVPTDDLLDLTDYTVKWENLPDVMKPFFNENHTTPIAFSGPPLLTDEDIKNKVDVLIRKTSVLSCKEDFSKLLSVLPEEKKSPSMSLYDLFYIIGNDKVLLDKIKKLDGPSDNKESKSNQVINLSKKNKLSSFGDSLTADELNLIIEYRKLTKEQKSFVTKSVAAQSDK